MLGRHVIDRLAGRDVYGSDGGKIGTVRQVYTDDQSGEPMWTTVQTGLFGLKESFLPLDDAELSGDRLTVPYTKDFVKDAPNIDEDGHLSPDQEEELYAYYGLTGYDDVDQGYKGYKAGRTGRGNYDVGRTGRGNYDVGRTGRGDHGANRRLRRYVVADQGQVEEGITRGYN